MSQLFKRRPTAFNDLPETGVDAGWQDLRRDGSIVSRTAYGAAWIIVWRFVNRFLGIISTLILARLLLPADFGVVALAMSFVQGLQQLAELGTENAIIRADMPDRQLYNTGFTINVLRGVGVGIVLALIAVPAGAFFDTPHFAQVALLAALVSIVSSFQNIGIVDYRRYMAFDREFLFKLIPRLLSVATAVTLAFVLRDYWALIIAILVNVCVDVLLSYVFHPYRPRFTLAGWPRMSSYSTLLWLSNIAGLLSTLGTRSTITKMTSVSSLGLYELASEIANLPTTELTGPLTRAMFSGLSEVRNQADLGAGLLLRMMTTMNLIVLPIGVGLSLVAEPTVQLAFGEKWLGAVPLLQVLALGEAISIFGQMSRQAFAVHGWMKALLKITLVFGLVQILILILMILKFGMPGIALALILSGISSGLVYFIVTMSRLKIPWGVLLSRVWRSFIAVMLMAVALNKAGFGWFDSHSSSDNLMLAWQLCVIIAMGMITYSLSLLVLWFIAGKPDGPETELLNYVHRYFSRKLARQR